MPTVPRTDLMLRDGAFAGKTIAITGGGTGLGRSMGECLLRLGAKLVICGRREEVITQAASEMMRDTGGEVFYQRCDVRDPEQVEALIAAATDKLGTIHGWINNAAGNFICPTERLSYNGFNAVVDIVLKGTANCTLAMGRRWIAEGTPGVFLSIIATYAWTGSGYVVPSAVAKAGVLMLSRSLASEWGKYNIRLNCIAPGPFPTEGAWSRLMPEQVADKFDAATKIPLGRNGEHQELANLASFLLSDYSAYMTGDCVTIDGGEWVRGAGMFNALEKVSSNEWDALQAMMRPRKGS
ncbi:MAG: SDR family oxidoreductase [Pirellulales bacterium]|nr:SDR family oxidoreductase [Pirellulales bacterium]